MSCFSLRLENARKGIKDIPAETHCISWGCFPSIVTVFPSLISLVYSITLCTPTHTHTQICMSCVNCQSICILGFLISLFGLLWVRITLALNLDFGVVFLPHVSFIWVLICIKHSRKFDRITSISSVLSSNLNPSVLTNSVNTQLTAVSVNLFGFVS